MKLQALNDAKGNTSSLLKLSYDENFSSTHVMFDSIKETLSYIFKTFQLSFP